MNEFVIKILRNIIKHLEESEIDRSIQVTDDNSSKNEVIKKKNHIAISGICILLVTGLYFFPSYFTLASIYKFYTGQYFGGNIKSDYLYVSSILFIIIQTLLFTNIFYIIKRNNQKIISYLYLIYFPLYFSSFLLSPEIFEGMYSRMSLFTIALITIIGVYPLIYIISSYFKKPIWSFITKIKNLFLLYNLGFFFLLSLNIALISIGFNLDFIRPWTGFIIELVSRSSYDSFYFLEGIMYILLCFFFITSGVFSLNIYFGEAGKSRKSVSKGLLLIALVFVFSLVPTLIDGFYEIQIERAAKIINTEGQNYKSYTDANVFLLERAFYSQIKNGRVINSELFKKIFDSTPEAYFGDKIADYSDSRYSFGTNGSKVGDKANVILNLSEIENKVSSGSSFQVLETTYRFNFTNTSTSNQEVIINFETPSKYSVVEGLKLGLDLELVGQISPRGAAKRVYEDSLRRNIDPALLEKVGLNTYNLRVFPIPSKNDIKTQGRQIVEVKMLTPILKNKEKIAYSPKFSFINLKFDENSGLHSKVYDGGKLIKEDIASKGEIEKYLKSEHILEFNSKNTFDIGKFCIEPKMFNDTNLINLTFATGAQDISKTNIFFDNSLSIKRNGTDKFYDEIYSKIKNHSNIINDVDIYSYNFDVNKVLSTSDIKFWGYSDIDRTIDYIINNKISYQRIILVTDDDSFNFGEIENKSRDYSTLFTNDISIIKIGKNIKSYKMEISNILSATNGNIYEVNDKNDIDLAISKVFAMKNANAAINLCGESTEDDDYKKIEAGYVSNALLQNIKSESDWQKIAELQTMISEKYNIVNQFNSLIALENQAQEDDLERYKKEVGKYDTTHNNNEGYIGSQTTQPFMPNRGTVDFSELRGAMEESSITYNSNGLNFASDKISSDIKGSSDSTFSSYSRGVEFSGRVDLSFLGLLMFFIYLVELYSLLTFAVNYKKGNK